MHEFKYERLHGKEQSKYIFRYKITAFEATITTYSAILELMIEFNDYRSRKQIKYCELLGNKFIQACRSIIWPHLKCCVLVSSSQKKRDRNQDWKMLGEKQHGYTMAWNNLSIRMS